MGRNSMSRRHHTAIVNQPVFIQVKLPKGSMVSADAFPEIYLNGNIVFEGALIPYDGTEKKVKVGVIKFYDLSSLTALCLLSNTVCCAMIRLEAQLSIWSLRHC
jgi:hypothetical protein